MVKVHIIGSGKWGNVLKSKTYHYQKIFNINFVEPMDCLIGLSYQHLMTYIMNKQNIG